MKDINRRILDIQSELESSAADKVRRERARAERRFGTLAPEPEKGLSDRKKRLLDGPGIKQQQRDENVSYLIIHVFLYTTSNQLQ